MSKLIFSKFHGAGNDFILIDDRALTFNPHFVPKLCLPKFGIGADGVILLQNDSDADFRMRIFNADGSEASSCGNGLRCLIKFMIDLGMPKKSYRIKTGERIVEADIVGDLIAVQLGLVSNVKRFYIDDLDVHFLDVGVPHAVVFTQEKLEILGPKIQRHEAFSPSGVNVNVAEIRNNVVHARTLERGVGETLACGTGAAAIGYIAAKEYQLSSPVRICMPGGELQIDIKGDEVTLIGEAIKVFEGLI